MTKNEDQSFRVYSGESLGTAIKYYREQARLTQSELADRVGINRTYLSQLEQGRETEALRRLLKVLRQLGVRITLERTNW